MPAPFPRVLGWVSGTVNNSSPPMTVQPSLPEGAYIVSVLVLPIHIYDKDPHPEPWDGLQVATDSALRQFTITPGGNPRDSIDFFMWQVTYGYFPT